MANHLTREDLEDAVLYCKYHCLLAMSAEQRVGQLVVWREVCQDCLLLNCRHVQSFDL